MQQPQQAKEAEKDSFVNAARQPLSADAARSFDALAPRPSPFELSDQKKGKGAEKSSAVEALAAAEEDDREAIDAVLRGIDASIKGRGLQAKIPSHTAMKGISFPQNRKPADDDYALYGDANLRGYDGLFSSVLLNYGPSGGLMQRWQSSEPGRSHPLDKSEIYTSTMICVVGSDPDSKNRSLVTMIIPHALTDGRPARYASLLFKLPSPQAALFSEMVQSNPDVVEYFYKIAAEGLDYAIARFTTTDVVFIDAVEELHAKAVAGELSPWDASKKAFDPLMSNAMWGFRKPFRHGPYGSVDHGTPWIPLDASSSGDIQIRQGDFPEFTIYPPTTREPVDRQAVTNEVVQMIDGVRSVVYDTFQIDYVTAVRDGDSDVFTVQERPPSTDHYMSILRKEFETGYDGDSNIDKAASTGTLLCAVGRQGDYFGLTIGGYIIKDHEGRVVPATCGIRFYTEAQAQQFLVELRKNPRAALDTVVQNSINQEERHVPQLKHVDAFAEPTPEKPIQAPLPIDALLIRDDLTRTFDQIHYTYPL